MKTSSNNNNIESKNTEFFTKGTRYRCTRDVIMKSKKREKAFTAGDIYEQATEATQFYGWLLNNQGDRHAWPQPAYIDHEVRIWDTTPADIDPRNYFEPVSE